MVKGGILIYEQCDGKDGQNLDNENIKTEKNYKKRDSYSKRGDFIFYLILFLFLIGVIWFKLSNDGPKSFAGFSAFIVVSSSMEPEIPKDSFIITKKIPEEELKIGDDITYLIGPNTTITHRIVRKIDNYDGKGQGVFETKGIANKNSDDKVVPYINIIGKVIYHNYYIGKTINFFRKIWYLILLFIIQIILIIKAFKLVRKFRSEER